MRNGEPEVSIIIPCYNRGDLLQRAIESVLKQTFQNYEIIIVDDGSTENIKEIIEKKYVKDLRIKYVFQKHVGRPGTTRNTGIIQAKAPYIAFLDSDDEWLPEKLKEQLEALKNANSEKIGAVGCDFYVVNLLTKRKREYHLVFDEKTMNSIERLLSGKLPAFLTLYLFKKEVFEQVGMFDDTFNGAEDYDLLVRVFEYYQFLWVNKPLCYYHVHANNRIVLPGSLMAKLQGQERLFAKFKKYHINYPHCWSWSLINRGRLRVLSGQTKQGRKYLFKAILKAPFDIRCYLHFFLSLFGLTIYRKGLNLWAYLRVGHV